MMSFWQFLRNLFFGPPEPDTEPLEESDDVLHRTRDGDEVIEVALRPTQELYDHNGLYAEQMVARQIQHAFDKTDYGYDISYNYEPFDVENEKSGCGPDSALHEWRDARDLQVAKDANLLLCNTDGGGCGAVGGKVATTAAANIDRFVEVKDRGSGDRIYNNLSGNLHELGHNLSLSHDEDKETPGRQHTGKGFNGPDGWHRTPMNVANDVTNVCGDYIEKRVPNSNVVSELYYTDCTVERFEVE